MCHRWIRHGGIRVDRSTEMVSKRLWYPYNRSRLAYLESGIWNLTTPSATLKMVWYGILLAQT
ncbi:hypothetical protein M8C21_006343, partial [Ambrosia artemisiifolia]